MNVLTLSDVHVSLSGRQILHDVDLTIGEGEIVGLLGPNGAGKTTLMRAIMGLIPTTSGTIERAGAPGYVPQRHDIAWNYPISVQETVMTSLQAHMRPWQWAKPADWRAVYDALDMVGMMELRDRTLDELSGGQKQRVLIARALAPKPRVLLLDEPFTGLDHPTQDSLTDLFTSLSAAGVAILMSTHDLTQAVGMSDRIALLAGTIRAADTPENMRDPQIWIDTFQVRPDSALLRTIGLGS
ncbi:anchored repeat-type ABC transporter ATP-binding subunit [Trueperella pyogenes]|uniref:Anchored repeat-type ABC transporter ATP-binding subunit n=1 Tax=Trueperella pyogenes TaxID=1661 RepID=X4QN54_9ACTO|nr:anchored repeat-type ABC transporter ATP-binding subunit [Trueperella pyogenes]AHU89122.1 ABC transporter ATP-binding protein [Trueperella pyogenes]AJC69462.1 ABC transporter ATP-binding protein [Trueperella pyogenes TP8]ALD74110.1 ABC transporter ATP-binding protein [Trueperella pyogenes]AWA43055.1 anchored repeat-type ABC transporter ATP-binding subunit [Trueperella pyogenes]AWG04491.1 anchored repeat-type ABC transporter ATP-binding subunit [Trueperella pyogenes]